MSGRIKRSFTTQELSVASATGFIRAIDRYQRPRIKGYPIDDQDPLRATDRDDAIYAERVPGGYLLHVTIADVAAHIPKDSVLDKAAQQRAFTIYRPPARDPMFPFVLSEDRFSLEHEQMRLGVTTTIELDEQFHPVNVEFHRTVIEPECMDYAGAGRRMQTEGDDLELLATIARGLRDKKTQSITPYSGSDMAYMDKAGHLRQGDQNTMAAAKLVEVMMIFANNEIAKFFDKTELPFLFRNHDPGPDNTAKAEYGPYDEGHYALRKSGLQGAYSHNTSPIRRYADLVNQRMMHYCMDVVEHLADEITELQDKGNKQFSKAAESIIWMHGEELFSSMFHVHQTQGHQRIIAEQDLRQTISNIVTDILPDADINTQQQSDPMQKLMATTLQIPLPYTHEELAAMTPTLNEAGAIETKEVKELNKRNLDKWNEKIADDLAAGDFDLLDPNAFSGMLRRAAVTGKINQEFAQEAISRINFDLIDTVVDCYSILVLNKQYENPHWRALKRAALNVIERDPMATNNIFEKGMKDGEIHADTYVAEAMVRDSAAEHAMPLLSSAGIQQQVEAALVVTFRDDMGGGEYAAPHYSLGYSRKDTARHARFNFLRSMAFGELGPVDQTILPTPLYAELNRDDRSRSKLLHEMAESMDLTINEFGPRKRPDGEYSFAFQVYGPGIEHSILGFVKAPDPEQAREKSATRILRNVQFKRAYANQHPMELGFPSNPAHVVRELAEAEGWELTEPDRHTVKEIERGVFSASIELEIAKGDVLSATCEARNKDNAIMFCFETIRDQLDARGLIPKEEQQEARGDWVTWAVASRDAGGMVRH